MDIPGSSWSFLHRRQSFLLVSLALDRVQFEVAAFLGERGMREYASEETGEHVGESYSTLDLSLNLYTDPLLREL